MYGGDQERIRCVFMRGGTSRGAYFLESDLPQDPVVRDQVILAVYGSPDPRQIDGIGGADSLTSKVAMVARSERPDADVDYTFAQVSITSPLVDYNSSCGNMASGVGPFAVDEGLVRVTEPITRVRIYHTNIRKVIVAEVPVKDGKTLAQGDCAIGGVPGTGARIMMDFQDVGGALTGKLLPTGRPRDTLRVDGRTFTASLVDAAVPVIFVLAEELGLRGSELPTEINADGKLLALLERIRGEAAVLVGLVQDPREATRVTPSAPKVAFVAPPLDYRASDSTLVAAQSIHLVARQMSMQKPHQAYAVTGGICAAVAAKIPGTVVHQVFQDRGPADLVRLGHPAGSMAFEVRLAPHGDSYLVTRAALERTARRIMDGYVYVPKSRFIPGSVPLIRQEVTGAVEF